MKFLNSGLLTANAWEMIHGYYKDVYDANGDGVGEEYESRDTVGVMNYDKYTYSIQCSDASIQNFDLTHENKTITSMSLFHLMEMLRWKIVIMKRTSITKIQQR